MRLRGFAMADGISFTDGKRRYTGRILPNGELEIRQGGSWLCRFSFRQKIAWIVLAILTCLDYGWKTFNDYWFLAVFLLIALYALRLSASQKQYHGAEHMAVNLFEGRMPTVFHPGCGSNLVLMLVPGLFLELLPFNFWITLLCEAIYLFMILKILWPRFQVSLRLGRPLAVLWWRLGRGWQRLFVAEPNQDQLLLAIQTLDRLSKDEYKE